MKVAVIGGGAAGFFSAINIAEKNPRARVTIFEKSNKLLSKVKVSGGGRCNVTNERQKPSELVPFYPRGGKKLYKPLSQFSTFDMRKWLEQNGVKTKAESDHRVFPASNVSQTIIDLFLEKAAQLNIRIFKSQSLLRLESKDNKWLLTLNKQRISFDKVVIATGSSEKSWKILEELGLKTESRVPSLFTFNIKDARLEGLPGVAFTSANTQVVKTKLKESGPLLITHWGLSGPAVLKLSAWGAKDLATSNYQFDIIVNFIKTQPDNFRSWLVSESSKYPKRLIGNLKIEGCPKRYYENLLRITQINPNKPLGDLSKKEINRLTEELTQARFSVKGKSTFKEEFVTCGGILLSEINIESMEAKRFPGLYFGGEVLNIDALTGGFNFQACWTAGWLISEHFKEHDKS